MKVIAKVPAGYLSLSQVAEALDCTIQTATRRIDRQRIPMYVGGDGRTKLIRAEDVKKLQEVRELVPVTA